MADDPIEGSEELQGADTTEAQTRFRDWLAERNYDVGDYKTDEEVLADLEGAYQRVQKAPTADEIERFEKLRPVVQEFAAHADDFHKWREQQAAEQTKQDEPRRVPQLSPVTQRMIDAGLLEPDARTGLYTGDPQFASQVREANEVIQWQRQAAQRVITDPVGFLSESGFDDHLKSIVEPYDKRITELEQRLADAAHSQVRNQGAAFFTEHAEEFWQRDQKGELTDRLTPVGEAIQDAIASARDLLGVDDTPTPEQEAKIHGFVQRAYARLPHTGTEEETSGDQVKEVRKQKQETFVQKAKRNGQVNRLENRSATVAAAAEREAQRNDTDDSIWDAAVKEAEAGLA